MSYEITARFFHWMEANNISRSEAAAALSVDERSLSNYRSRGLPRKKHPRAEQIMREHFAAKQQRPSTPEDNRISVVFNDADYELVSEAARIVGSLTKEFIHKAAVSRAKEEIQKQAQLNSSLVAEGPCESPPITLARKPELPEYSEEA